MTVKKLFLSKYEVTGSKGDRYMVDTATGTCTCPDALYRPRPEGCKHVRLAASWTPTAPRGGQYDTPVLRG